MLLLLCLIVPLVVMIMNVYSKKRLLSLFQLSFSALISLIFFKYAPLVTKIFLGSKFENEVKIIVGIVALILLALAADKFGKSLEKIKDQEEQKQSGRKP